MKLSSKLLLTKIEPTTKINKKLANDMMSFVRRKKAYGLAANQIGENIRLFVMDVNQPRRCFNPTILSRSNVVNKDMREGCLSYPGKFIIKPRSTCIRVAYTNQEGNLIQAVLQDEEAICYQHELDHLDGLDWEKTSGHFNLPTAFK